MSLNQSFPALVLHVEYAADDPELACDMSHEVSNLFMHSLPACIDVLAYATWLPLSSNMHGVGPCSETTGHWHQTWCREIVCSALPSSNLMHYRYI